MGILGTSSNYQNCIKSTNNKIPEYAREYKKEYLYIRGLNKEFKFYEDRLDNPEKGLFVSYKEDRIMYFIKRFLRAQEKGKLKDINDLMLPKYDILFIEKFYNYLHTIIIFEDEYKIFFNKLKIKCDNEECICKYDSDSDSDSDSDDF